MSLGSRLARNSLWNLLGQGVPLVGALLAIPILVSELGTERFGIVTLVWMAIGYFSLFDLGMGRALTKLVAERLDSEAAAQIPALVWTALYLMLGLGLLGTMALLLITQALVEHLLNISASLREEARNAFWVLGLSLPVVVLTSALRGILEATQSFAALNAIRIPMGLASFIAPLAVLPFSTSLVPITLVLLLVRALGLLAHWRLARGALPSWGGRTALRADAVKPLLGFGGWMTVTNVVGPAMVYLDRFLIGSLLSMTAVAYYVAPYELITKLLILPVAVSTTLFPAFAASRRDSDEACGQIFTRGVKYVFLMLLPGVFFATLFAREILSLWLGPAFADASTAVLQLLALGVLINGLAFIPFALIQSLGRPDLTAKLHLVELPFYAICIWMLAARLGLVGIALAWTLRVLIDALAMFLLVPRLMPSAYRGRKPVLSAVAVAACLALAAVCPAGLAKLTLALASALGFGYWGWTRCLSADERGALRQALHMPAGGR